ncbi:endonuclease/exonuclease/phosphatase family protein [Nocardia sp. CDC160]|uniref:endonuclease/exonuclease/phosphatase family protein n=1 Tax=Nocardia sp. CDC160 TaxID=3112166 RepID=UPI002DBBB9B6|nr:endonuclease/exonuclease/phosphatase family protein [Nocardia sp. CDC160]MEC3918904.1 endonuclease/exonuclease/phosphatase family protein [Nocardia sp. CDC160]
MKSGTLVFVAAAALLTVLLAAHDRIPDAFGLGVALDTAAPWLIAPVPVLAVVAVLCRRPAGAAAFIAPLLVWAYTFGSWWAPTAAATAPSSSGTVKVVSQNLFADNPSPVSTARALVATNADLIAVQEFAGADRPPIQRILDAAYPYHEERGTVALWSRYPTSDTTTADVGIGWQRGLRTHVDTPYGDLVVYVVHLPSIRPADTATRNEGLKVLSRQLSTERAPHVLVAGDFNTATTDRHWASFAPGYTDAQLIPGSGPGFTWPSTFPLARLDHLLVRGLHPVTASVQRVPGPDHRAPTATVAFPRR